MFSKCHEIVQATLASFKSKNANQILPKFIDPINNDVIPGKILKYMSFVLNEFSQIANIESHLTTYWYKRGEQLRNEWCIYDKL